VEDFQKLKEVLETMKQKLTDSPLPESLSQTQDQSEPEAIQPIQMNLF